MSDYTAYESESDLRENLEDVRALQAEFNERQKAIDQIRTELATKIRQSKIAIERKLVEHKNQYQELQKEQAQLIEQRAPYDESSKRLQQQLEAKKDAKRENSTGDATISQKSGAQELGDRKQGAQEKPSRGVTTKADVEKLKSQTGKPTIELNYDPPELGTSQASQVDRDLRLMNEAREKQGRLDQASQNMRDNWNQSSGPKR